MPRNRRKKGYTLDPKKQEYEKALKSSKWRAKRKLILIRDGNCCTACGESEVQLHVHHDRYYSNRPIWDVEDEYLRTLCKKCHEKFHEDNKYEKLTVVDLDYPIEQVVNKPIYKKKKKKAKKAAPNRYAGMNSADKKLQMRYDALREEGKLK